MQIYQNVAHKLIMAGTLIIKLEGDPEHTHRMLNKCVNGAEIGRLWYDWPYLRLHRVWREFGLKMLQIMQIGDTV